MWSFFMIGQGGASNFLAPGRHEITHETKTPSWLIFGVVLYLKVCSRYVDLFFLLFLWLIIASEIGMLLGY